MKKILIVEDEEDVRRNLEDLLEAEGFEVLSAKDGMEGYEMAVAKEPALILSDIRMPRMDGLALLQKLQENSSAALIPFIFLTAKIELKDMRKGMTIGADDYITKPFKADDVLDAINSRLNKNDKYLSVVKEFKEVLMKRVPHELRTPLVGILGLSEIMHDDLENLSNVELKEMAAGIRRSGKRLHRRIEKFLSYTELLSQNGSSNFVNSAENECDVEPEDLSKRLMLKAEEFDRKADLKLQFEMCRIKINPLHFDTMLDELLENSLKFSPKNTSIIVSGARSGKNYIIKISDEGKSIGKTNFQKINVFNKLDRKDLADEGMGMGLAIVKKIIELNAGYLSFENTGDFNNVVEAGIPIVKNN